MDLRLVSPNQAVALWRADKPPITCVVVCVSSPAPGGTGRLQLVACTASTSACHFAGLASMLHPCALVLRGSRTRCDVVACARHGLEMVVGLHHIYVYDIRVVAGNYSTNVDYDYAGKQPIPAAGLTPAQKRPPYGLRK